MYGLLFLLCVTLNSLTWSTIIAAQDCDYGWFGSSCQYKCRCKDNQHCSQNGSCKDGICESGWFGPACQYLDLLYNKDPRTRNWLKDGDVRTCNPATSFSVSVNRRYAFQFTWLRLQVNQPSLLQEFQVTFTDTRNERKIPCKNMRRAVVDEKTLDIHCDMDELVQSVILTGSGVKSVCSFYISGGRNVALRQNTTQSSTYFSLVYSYNFSASWNAVDGNINNGLLSTSCTSTTGVDKNPNWNVTLSSPHKINIYRVYNKGGYQDHIDRIKGFTLRSFTKDRVMVFNYTDMQDKAIPLYVITSAPKTPPVSLVNIHINNKGKDAVLNMCEVELYGDSSCPPSMYGRDCEHKCNCAVRDESCFVSTGGCPSGCAAGYQGEDCQQPCGFGKYGDGCKSNCSQYCVTTNNTQSPCFHTNGLCVRGCLNGHRAPECEHLLTSAEEETIPVSTVVIPLVIVVLLIMVAVLGVFLWRRFRPASNKHLSTVAYSNRNTSNRSSCDQIKYNTGFPPISSNGGEHKIYIDMSRVAIKKQPIKNLTIEKNSNDNVYSNTTPVISSTSISVRELSHFLASHDKVFFQQQFNSIPANINATTNVGLNEENKHKNRYKNICAYDHSRVLLKTCNVKKWGDYINASYIDGYKGMWTFIASQGPTKDTLEDFIRMLVEQEVEIVVMLTNLAENGKTKCERYWPEDNVIKAGDIKVKLTSTEVFTDYTIRRLQLLGDGAFVHELTQFHFTAWPDKDVPTIAWSLLDFEQRLASVSTDKPIVVHCSAGVGRTGTFIALCNVIMEAIDTGYIDFFTAVQKLRHDRSFMVQTLDQYEFLHRAALVAVVCLGTSIVSSNITERIEDLKNKTESGQSKLDQEFKAVCDICDDVISCRDGKGTAQSSSTYEHGQNLSNKLKNRFQNVLVREDYRVILMGDSDEGLGDYINAVFIPSLSRKNQHILTQIPLPTTVNDFWRMVTQYKVTLVVAFEVSMMEADSSIGTYFPLKESEEVSTSDYMIGTQQVSSCVLWDKQKVAIRTVKSEISAVSVTSSSAEAERRLTHITYKGSLTNQTPSDLLALMKEVRSCSPMGDGRVVYMCRNGAEYSGLVCVLSLLLDRLDNDLRLTVPLVVGAVKAVRPQVVPTVRQYSLLYQVLQLYNDSNNVYNNFET